MSSGLFLEFGSCVFDLRVRFLDEPDLTLFLGGFNSQLTYEKIYEVLKVAVVYSYNHVVAAREAFA